MFPTENLLFIESLKVEILQWEAWRWTYAKIIRDAFS